MASKEDKAKIETGLTNEVMKDKFMTELGQKAIVEHHQMNEQEKYYVAQLRGVLADSAKDLQKVGIANKGFDYLGSLSVHVYASEVMRAFEFMAITNPFKMTHPVADAALRKLTQDVNEHYTGKRQKLRSGF